MPGAIDKSVWVGSQEQPRWTVYLTNGTQDIVNGVKRFTHPQPNAFNQNGIHRDAIAAAVGQVYQIDVRVTGDIADQTFALFGFRTDDSFVVTPTIIYHYLNRDSGEGLNVQTFPSETSLGMSKNEWYTLKARVATNALDMFIHGGPEGYSNQLIATESFSGVHSGNIRTQFNVAGTPASGGYFEVRNYLVSTSMNASVETAPINMTGLAFMTKEAFA